MRLVECGAVAAAAVRSVWQRCQIYRGARDIWSRPRVHDAPRDVDEVFDDLFDEKVPNVSQSDWAVAVHPEGVKRGKAAGRCPSLWLRHEQAVFQAATGALMTTEANPPRCVHLGLHAVHTEK